MVRVIKRIFLLVIVAAVAVVIYYGYSFAKFGMGIHEPQAQIENPEKPSTNEDKEPDTYTPPDWEGKERVNILLLGADARDAELNQKPRTDTMMIVSIDPVTKQAVLFSLLRDTYTEIPGRGHGRVNAANVYGGPELAMETVSRLTGLSVQYYIYVDFQGFVTLVDAIGGVEYNVEKDMKYTSRADGPEFDIDLKAGLQVLDGSKALQYVRFRQDARSDYGRTERQRNFMQAVAKKMQTTTNIIKLPSILNQIEPYIQTNLTLNNMLRLGNLALRVDTSSLNTQQLPPPHLLREEVIDGSEVLTADRQRLLQFIEEETKPKSAANEEPAENTANAAAH